MKRAAAIAAVVGLAGAGVALQPPDDPTLRPSVRVPACTDGGCHAAEVRHRFLHAPLAVGACEVCHAYQSAVEHTFLLKHTGAAMCDFCHIGKSVPGRAAGTATDLGPAFEARAPWLHVHEPVAEGDCTACHDPHGSDVRRLIRADSVGALCSSCHESVTDHAHIHTPVAEGDCTSCHRPHSSILPNLLVREGRGLCVGCHADIAGNEGPKAVAWEALRIARGMGFLRGVSFPGAPHQPALGECSECHEPHGGVYASMLREPIADLCAGCHEDVAAVARAAPVSHPAMAERDACLNCHAPHRGAYSHMLRDKPLQLCLECHAERVERADGSTVAAMGALAKGGQHLHGPLAQGRCHGCHQVHGAEHPSLLSAAYSPELYQSFTAEAYALCFTCHDADLAREPQTTAATRFRDGAQNLHYIHVSAQEESGRSCRLCHDAHAGAAFPRLHGHILYGQWKLPIRFETTETGGSCDAGCHRARAYDRESPVADEIERSGLGERNAETAELERRGR